jgi:hypothetical protein
MDRDQVRLRDANGHQLGSETPFIGVFSYTGTELCGSVLNRR